MKIDTSLEQIISEDMINAGLDPTNKQDIEKYWSNQLDDRDLHKTQLHLLCEG